MALAAAEFCNMYFAVTAITFGQSGVRMRKKETHLSLSLSRSVSMKTHRRQLKEGPRTTASLAG